MLETGQVKTLSGTPEILEKNCGKNIEPMPNHHDLFYSLFFQKISFDFETMIGYVTKHCDISNSRFKIKKTGIGYVKPFISVLTAIHWVKRAHPAESIFFSLTLLQYRWLVTIKTRKNKIDKLLKTWCNWTERDQ